MRDNPPNPQAEGCRRRSATPVFTGDDRPETMHCIEFIREIIDSYPARMLCGEVQGKTDRIGHFYITTGRACICRSISPCSIRGGTRCPWQPMMLFNAIPRTCLAGLGDRRPRQATDREHDRRGADARASVAADDLARNAVLLHGRRIGRARVPIPLTGSSIPSRSWCRVKGFARSRARTDALG